MSTFIIRGHLIHARQVDAEEVIGVLEAMRRELPPGPVVLSVRIDGEHLDLLMATAGRP